MKKKRLLRLFILLVMVGWVTAVATPQVYAHASVAGSDPADNAILDEAPRQVRIRFTEPVAVD